MSLNVVKLVLHKDQPTLVGTVRGYICKDLVSLQSPTGLTGLNRESIKELNLSLGTNVRTSDLTVPARVRVRRVLI